MPAIRRRRGQNDFFVRPQEFLNIGQRAGALSERQDAAAAEAMPWQNNSLHAGTHLSSFICSSLFLNSVLHGVNNGFA
jgi:hypothetical protein